MIALFDNCPSNGPFGSYRICYWGSGLGCTSPIEALLAVYLVD